MSTLSFKAQDDFVSTLKHLAQYSGINLSAYIKLLLTKSVQKELSQVTENGLTVAEELEILRSVPHSDEDRIGPFSSVEELKRSLLS